MGLLSSGREIKHPELLVEAGHASRDIMAGAERWYSHNSAENGIADDWLLEVASCLVNG